MKDRILWMLTKWMKPCHFFKVVKGPKRDYVKCEYDGGYRKRCGTYECPHFTPTGRYKLARFLGMVKH